MKLDLNKPLKSALGRDRVEYLRKLREPRGTKLLCVVTYRADNQGVLLVDEEGKDYLGKQRVINALEIKKTYWLAHWKDGSTTLLEEEPCQERNPDCLAITGPHYNTLKEGRDVHFS